MTGTKRGGFYAEIFLIALSVILLEISYTRIFSYKVFYYFTYLIIGIALLGLGTGGVLVAVSRRLRAAEGERLIPILCLIAGASVPATYAVVALVQLNISLLADSWLELAKLFLVCTAMFVPFLVGGIAIAAIFAARPTRIPRLYFADLMGAGIGCLFVVQLMRALSPPGIVILCGVLFALAALPLARRAGLLHVCAAAVLAAANAALLAVPGAIPEPVPDQIKNMAPSRMKVAVDHLHAQWDPVFRVDVISATEGPFAGRHFLIHDGVVGSSVTGWDGKPESLRFFDESSRTLPFRVLDREARVVIIGAAGGREVAAAIHFGAREILAVELNPVTVSLMTDKFADYSGRLMFDPRVTLVNAEGRNFVGGLEHPVDLIWLVAPDSYAAMNAATAGAFVLSESYLYTVEMMRQSLSRLGDEGILCAQFGDRDFKNKPKRTSRYLATAREALRRDGVENFGRHVLVATTPDFPFPSSTILVKRTPFSLDEIERFRAAVHALDTSLGGGEDHSAEQMDFRERAIVWHAGETRAGPKPAHPVNHVISLPDSELVRWFDEFEYDVGPITDDSPFFYHFVRLRDVLFGSTPGDAGPPGSDEALGERVLLILLAFGVVFGAAMTLLPLVAIRGIFGRLPHKLDAVVYFSALGLGFMFFEVSLIQQLTLFIGYPTHSLTVTLFALLISTAIGSLCSERYVGRHRSALPILLGALVVLSLLYQLGLEPALAALSPLGFNARVVLAALMIAPLGVCLGAFMPVGLAAVSGETEYKQQIIAWCWAINGFSSVVGSTLATVLSMSFGFGRVQLVALAVYGIGVFALRRVPETTR